MPRPSPLRTALLTALTLVAFAGNSLLCRAALADGAIGPLAFTAIRLVCGALALLPFLRGGGRWDARGALALLAYAVAFSLAYVRLDAGIGALLLFGAVQITMVGAGIVRGERPSRAEGAGILVAALGVVMLVGPGASAPDPVAAGSMLLAGAAWGVYSLVGRGATAPAAGTARNFALAAPAAVLVGAVGLVGGGGEAAPTARGVALAVASGALTSGYGYVLWYAALRGLTATRAAAVQLAVPALAALGGVVLLEEDPTVRLLVCSVLTLGGLGWAVRARR